MHGPHCCVTANDTVEATTSSGACNFCLMKRLRNNMHFQAVCTSCMLLSAVLSDTITRNLLVLCHQGFVIGQSTHSSRSYGIRHDKMTALLVCAVVHH